MSWGDWLGEVPGALLVGTLGLLCAYVAIQDFQQDHLWGTFVAGLLAILLLSLSFEAVKRVPGKHTSHVPVEGSASSMRRTLVLVLLALVFGIRALWNTRLIIRRLMPFLHQTRGDLLAAGAELGVTALMLSILREDYDYWERGPLLFLHITLWAIAVLLLLFGMGSY